MIEKWGIFDEISNTRLYVVVNCEDVKNTVTFIEIGILEYETRSRTHISILFVVRSLILILDVIVKNDRTRK